MHHHHRRIVQALSGIGNSFTGGLPNIPTTALDPRFHLEVNDIHLLWRPGATMGIVSSSSGWVSGHIEAAGSSGNPSAPPSAPASSAGSPPSSHTPNLSQSPTSQHQQQRHAMQFTISISPQVPFISPSSYHDTSYLSPSTPDDDDFHALLFDTCKSVPTLRRATFHNICGQWRHKTRSYTRLHDNAEWVAA
ncbi:uncharacterized protein EI90DRAFT_3051508 [Cantharellus anzutake]|uniref:uncharacterized protein n=1 Tax=Cantharellus anzutake TaxID=1750568 RepID=UPI001908F4E9|nr:uncharacterized protein EI90DRAFT_3051508 [Cantharellus anzutake]KAF8334224.1 hypothetical protein EI90DRAFT_3051508 [Cantharellus anzutake]